jgi:hypothetical protein
MSSSKQKQQQNISEWNGIFNSYEIDNYYYDNQ